MQQQEPDISAQSTVPVCYFPAPLPKKWEMGSIYAFARQVHILEVQPLSWPRARDPKQLIERWNQALQDRGYDAASDAIGLTASTLPLATVSIFEAARSLSTDGSVRLAHFVPPSYKFGHEGYWTWTQVQTGKSA